jgi:hypothetical protein
MKTNTLMLAIFIAFGIMLFAAGLVAVIPEIQQVASADNGNHYGSIKNGNSGNHFGQCGDLCG